MKIKSAAPFPRRLLTPAVICLMGLNSSNAASPLKVVTFGDSTTAPRPNVVVYTDQLKQRFAGQGIAIDFVNKGVPGNTTAMAMARFAKDVVQEKPDVVIIQFGINDSMMDVWKVPPKTESRVSMADYEANLRHFIADIRGTGGNVILMTPNQLRWTRALTALYGKPPYQPENPAGLSIVLAQYADIVRKLAYEYNIPLVDVYALDDAWEKTHGTSCSALLTDGMHPNTESHRMVTDALEPMILQFSKTKGN